MNQLEVEIAELQFSAYGGRMNEVSESSLPFPHRAGIEFISNGILGDLV
jgi:hypothetical protein